MIYDYIIQGCLIVYCWKDYSPKMDARLIWDVIILNSNTGMHFGVWVYFTDCQDNIFTIILVRIIMTCLIGMNTKKYSWGSWRLETKQKG